MFNKQTDQLSRPYIIVERGKPRVKRKHIQKLLKNEMNFDDFLSKGLIEYLVNIFCPFYCNTCNQSIGLRMRIHIVALNWIPTIRTSICSKLKEETKMLLFYFF